MSSHTHSADESEVQITGENLVATNESFENFSSVFLVVAIAAVVIALYVFRDQWLPFLYERTVGSCHMRSCRDYACCGLLCSLCCGCCLQPYHPKYRLIITVERIEKLQTGVGILDWATRVDIYVQVKCGKNPIKTTSSASLRSQAATWNEELELDILTSDANIYLAVKDEKQNLYGYLVLDTTNVYDHMVKPSKGSSDDDDMDIREVFDNAGTSKDSTTALNKTQTAKALRELGLSELAVKKKIDRIKTESIDYDAFKELAREGKLGQPSKLSKEDEVAGLLYLSFSMREYGEPEDLRESTEGATMKEAEPLIDKGP